MNTAKVLGWLVVLAIVIYAIAAFASVTRHSDGTPLDGMGLASVSVITAGALVVNYFVFFRFLPAYLP
jgi:hypothetical protein